jgi:hypothetical protein
VAVLNETEACADLSQQVQSRPALGTPPMGLIDSLGIAGNANSNEDSSTDHHVSAGNNQQFSGDGNPNTASSNLVGHRSTRASTAGIACQCAATTPNDQR